jgi:hypothetical protein
MIVRLYFEVGVVWVGLSEWIARRFHVPPPLR